MDLFKRMLAVVVLGLLGLVSVACGNTAEGVRQDAEENVEEADQQLDEGGGEDEGGDE